MRVDFWFIFLSIFVLIFVADFWVDLFVDFWCFFGRARAGGLFAGGSGGAAAPRDL